MQKKAAAHADETPRPAPANETPAEATRERAPQGESSAGILTRSKSVPCIVWLAICCALVAVMLASGFNFFPLVALALAMISFGAWIYFVLKYAGLKVFLHDTFGNKADPKEVALPIYFSLFAVFFAVGDDVQRPGYGVRSLLWY